MLRERTLKHLLLVVARSLEEVSENSLYRQLLRDSCESLEISRENKGPYKLTVSNANGEKVTTVETTEFRFHERGDVQGQVQKRIGLPDARTQNWERATLLWQELLGVELKKSQGLAPPQTYLPKVNRKEVFVLGTIAILLLFFEYSNSQAWPVCLFLAWTVSLVKPSKPLIVIALSTVLISWTFPEQGNTAFFLPLVIAIYHLENLYKSRLIVFLPLAALVGLMVSFPHQIPAMIIIIMFEIIVSIAQMNLYRFSVQSIGLLMASMLLFLLDPGTHALNYLGFTTLPFALILMIVVFPYSSESNLIRISAPLSLSIAAVFFEIDTKSAISYLLVWSIQIIKSARSTQPIEQSSEISGTPVTLRRIKLPS
jgi:hypothetical protein